MRKAPLTQPQDAGRPHQPASTELLASQQQTSAVGDFSAGYKLNKAHQFKDKQLRDKKKKNT